VITVRSDDDIVDACFEFALKCLIVTDEAHLMPRLNQLQRQCSRCVVVAVDEYVTWQWRGVDSVGDPFAHAIHSVVATWIGIPGHSGGCQRDEK
jgi:hypothetical protein